MIRPLDIAVVTETFPPEVNGVAMTIGRMVEGMRKRGHAVHMVRPRQPGDPRRDEGLASTTLVPGLPIPGYPALRFGFPAGRLLRRQWRARRPDVVQVVTEGPLGASAVGAARALGIPVVTEFHTNFHAYSRHYGLGWLERLVALHLRRHHNRGDVTLVPSHQLGIDLMRHGYCNVRVVARGVDTRLFHPSRRSAALRASWGVGADDLVVAHVGRLAPEKNLNLAFATFRSLAAHAARARLVLVGDGPSRARFEREHPDHVYAGMRHGEDLAAHYASADLFLFPSLTETYGNVVLEAMASGLPVVAYRMAAAAELIRHGHNGMLAEPGLPGRFAESAHQLVSHPASRARIGAEAAHSVSALDWERIHERLEAVLLATVTTAGSFPGASGRVGLLPD
jgi:glycosyltransferase involved in cell wall biosynthesis